MANFSSPAAVDTFTRVMAAPYDENEIVTNQTGFLSFFDGSGSSETLFSESRDVVDIDIMRTPDLALAPMVIRGMPGLPVSGVEDVSGVKFSSFARKYPLIYQPGSISAEQLNQRRPGESSDSNAARIDRCRWYAKKIIDKITANHARTWEYLAAQSITAGTMPAIIGTTETDLIYDFMRKATHIYTVSTKWDDGASHAETDLDTAWTLINRDSHMNAEMLIMGSSAVPALQNNFGIKALYDYRRADFIKYGDNVELPARFNKFVKGGMTFLGNLLTPLGHKIYCFSYDGGYTNASGTWVPYIAAKKAVLCPAEVRCDRYFGPAATLPVDPAREQWYRFYFGMSPTLTAPVTVKNNSLIDPRAFHFDGYPSPDGTAVQVRVQSAPIFAPIQTDAFVTMQVLA